VVEDNSELVQGLLDGGLVTDEDVTTVDGRLAFRHAQGVRDPNAPVDAANGIGLGGRVLFQVVPEAKVAKNRVHLDLQVGLERRADFVRRLGELGATVLWEGHQGPSSWITMADPEGNEFCVS
jgi:hypothetical protein